MEFLKSIALQAMFKESVKDIEVLLESINRIKEMNFYDTIEFYYEGSKNESEQIKNLLKSINLRNIFLAGYPMKAFGVNPGDLDSVKRKAAVEKLKHWVDCSYNYNSDKMVVLSGKVYDNENDNNRAIEYTIESLRTVCQYARKTAKDYVLPITFEFFNNAGDPYLLVGDIRTTIYVAENIRKDYDNFEITFDLSHILQLKEDPIESLIEMKQYINHIHLANCVINNEKSSLYGDKHPPFNIEGGEVDKFYLYDFLNKMHSKGFWESKIMPVTIGIEVLPLQGSSETDVMRESTVLFKNCIQQY